MTSIPDSAFSGCKKLLEIKLPNNITSIESQAFYCCQSLREINIPVNTESIGEKAFYHCESLREINIPANTESIGNAAFQGCLQLTDLTFDKGSKLKAIAGSYGESIEIGTLNCAGTFMACKNLSTIEIPASVEMIDACAFRWCDKLTSITFEKGSKLTRLGGGYIGYGSFGCFAHCKALISIEIPASVKVIDAAAFYECTSLTDVFVENGSQLQIIDGGIDIRTKVHYGAFSECTALQRFDAQNCTQVTTIGEAAFHNCNNLTLFKIGTKMPPTCGNDTFSLINSLAVLKVPSEYIDAYKVANVWKNFTSISSLDE